MHISSARTTLRAALAVALTVGLAATTAGCSEEDQYTEQASSDGVRLELGPLLLSDLMVVASEEGAPGVLLGAVSNDGDEPTRVTIGLVDGPEAAGFDLDAGATVLLTPEDREIRFDTVPAPPGADVEIEVSSSAHGDATVRVPVLDDTFERYDEVVPTPTR